MRETFRYCPRCGREGIEFSGPRLVRCAGCDLHFYLNITTAVAALLEDDSGRLLLVRRDREPSKGKLGFPGGFVDEAETAEDALRREIREEVGLETREVEFLCSCPNLYTYRGVTYSVLDFFFRVRVSGFGGAEAREEVAGLVEAMPEEVDPEQLAFPSLRVAFVAYRRRVGR